ncbi:MAG: type II toxin-antitoxin system HicB family antitoxin [Oscillospiraceae bacterium]|jgi:predicted RNase H-like HicB family nuclease|nr:type II toxin-antitoxin system HicB family antitoxin [Oscillospiraceae bacterium]
MDYVYPAIFHTNEDKSFTISFPDLSGCLSEGKSLANAMYMAEQALTQWIEYLIDSKQNIPTPSNLDNVKTKHNEFVNLVRIEIKENRAIKRTVSLPKWMDDKASDMGLSLSRVLQEAVVKKIN